MINEEEMHSLEFAGKSYIRFLIIARIKYLFDIFLFQIWLIPWIIQIMVLIRTDGIYMDQLICELLLTTGISLIIDNLIRDKSLKYKHYGLRAHMDCIKMFCATRKGFQAKLKLHVQLPTEKGDKKRYVLVVANQNQVNKIPYRSKSINDSGSGILSSTVDQYCDIIMDEKVTNNQENYRYCYLPELNLITIFPDKLSIKDLRKFYYETKEEVMEYLGKPTKGGKK